MFVRFLMVSAVVTLGFEGNPPSGCDFAQWATRGQAWCNARLAEAEETLSGAGSRIEENLTILPARLSQWLASFQEALPEDPAPIVATPVEPVTPVAAAPVAADPDLAFQTALADSITGFATDLPQPEPAAPATLLAETPTAAEPAPPAPDFELELYPGLAFALNRAAEGTPVATCAPVPEAVVVEVVIPAAPEAPAEQSVVAAEPLPAPAAEAGVEPVSESTIAALAVVEATPIEATAVVETTPAPKQLERLSTAVQLTGKAIHAWVSLLQAPAVAYNEGSGSLSR